MKKVNEAYARLHSDLQKVRKDARGEEARAILDEASDELKTIRKDAVAAIHDSAKCEKDDDEVKDDEDRADSARGDQNWLVKLVSRLFGGDNVTVTVVTASASPSASASPAPSATAAPSASPAPSTSPAPSGSDPQTIADNAVVAMQLVFNTAMAKLEGLTPTATARPERTSERSDHGKGKSSEQSGKSRDDGDKEDDDD